MKGIVFNEFLGFVESQIGPEQTEAMLSRCDLPSGGAYTTVGTYDHQEIVTLVGQLSTMTGTPAPELVRAFGRHLMSVFAAKFPTFFGENLTAFAFLRQVENHIHVEVRKLYPDAELPSFEYDEHSADEMVMVYRSRRGFGDLAEGLIVGTFDHFGETIDIQREYLGQTPGSHVRFVLTRKAAA